MVMSNDLDAPRRLSRAVPMMKVESVDLPRIAQLDAAAQLPVVVPGEHDHFT